ELPHPHETSYCSSAQLHTFGAISLTYKKPFESTLQKLRDDIPAIDNRFQEQSVSDSTRLFKRLKPFISKPNFFSIRSSYLVIQVNPGHQKLDASRLKELYGNIIASTLRFETFHLSDYQKNEILNSSIGYFKGDLIIIDTGASFIYDPDYEELLDFFSFSNIQHLQLRYFDRLLDQQLTSIYENNTRKPPFQSYLPFIGALMTSPIDELGRLKVDISVITERLEGSIKLVGEPYFSELYTLLIEKLDLPNWKDSIEKKLSIIHDVRSLLGHKVDTIREDMLTTLIIILIFIELIVGILRL
ncbi:MAG: hypothetical protein WBQ73_03095, partial [Candidatus Babeliales bacterium]